MTIKKLIQGRGYSPETLTILQTAFDNAWLVIAPTLSDDPVNVETARSQLARIVLAIHEKGGTGSSQIAAAAVDVARQVICKVQPTLPTQDEIENTDNFVTIDGQAYPVRRND